MRFVKAILMAWVALPSSISCDRLLLFREPTFRTAELRARGWCSGLIWKCSWFARVRSAWRIFFPCSNASPGHPRARLTSAQSGIESEASFSHDGKLVTYSFAASPSSKSTVWVVGADGNNPHPLTNADEDALHPAFSPDDKNIFYAAPAGLAITLLSRLHGGMNGTSTRERLTPNQARLLSSLQTSLSTNLLPLMWQPTGSGRQNQNPSKHLCLPDRRPLRRDHPRSSRRKKDLPASCAGCTNHGWSIVRRSALTDGGMTIVFLAASEPPGGGNYDDNVYSMSDVTGSDLKQITHVSGMTTELHMLPPNNVSFVNAGTIHTATMTSSTK